jgi:two-component system, LytTR family, response regulator
MTIRTLIVDDEPRARKGIRARLVDYPNIQVIGECSSGREAVESINALAPDLLFLDIQMPELNGFDVLRNVIVSPLPVVIFVTAYDQYAVKAFEFHAFDYLLKPIAENRFREALSHVAVELDHRELYSYPDKIKAMMNDYVKLIGKEQESKPVSSSTHRRSFLQRLMIKTTNDITIVPTDEILWIESAGDLVFVHTKAKKHVLRETLTVLEEDLDPKQFARIHRSAMVNIAKVKHLHPVSHGDFDVQLENGMKLRLSRTYRSQFQHALQKS